MVDLRSAPSSSSNSASASIVLARCGELRTIYDAAYVALAEALSTMLLAADRRLADAPAGRGAVEVFS